MTRYTIEKTELEEKETFIHIDEYDKTVTITTHCARVFRKLLRAYGDPHKIFAPVTQKEQGFISGASWTFNYIEERHKLKSIFSMVNILPHS